MKITLMDKRTIESVPFVNPDETYGSPYLVGTSCGYSVFFGLVIADSLESAIDEYVESDHGKGLRIDPDDMDDYITVVIDGERMDVFDARRRFPQMDIDAVIRDGWEDGSTEERCHHTGQGEVYDSDHLYLEDTETIRKVEAEPGDFQRFPKQFPAMDETRDIIRESFARSAFVLEWAEAEEETGTSFSGMELTDVAPEETPLPYLRWAESSIRRLEETIGIGIVEALYRACFVPVLNSWEDRCDPDDAETAETFGHTVGMQFQGHGVGWEDDHPPLPFQLPYGESPGCFLFGLVTLAELEETE
jgi:hypothetical protein